MNFGGKRFFQPPTDGWGQTGEEMLVRTLSLRIVGFAVYVGLKFILLLNACLQFTTLEKLFL